VFSAALCARKAHKSNRDFTHTAVVGGVLQKNGGTRAHSLYEQNWALAAPLVDWLSTSRKMLLVFYLFLLIILAFSVGLITFAFVNHYVFCLC
jgi:hypothetical protein